MTLLELILLIVCTAQFIILVVRNRMQKADIEFLTADFSERIQEYQRKVVVLCTDENSQEALDICLHTKLNRAAEEMLSRNVEGNESYQQ